MLKKSLIYISLDSDFKVFLYSIIIFSLSSNRWLSDPEENEIGEKAPRSAQGAEWTVFWPPRRVEPETGAIRRSDLCRNTRARLRPLLSHFWVSFFLVCFYLQLSLWLEFIILYELGVNKQFILLKRVILLKFLIFHQFFYWWKIN